MNDTLGQVIRDLRERKGLSLRKLAKLVGVSAPFMCDVERDRRRTERLSKIAEVLGVPESRLRMLDNRLTSDLKIWIERHPKVLARLRAMQRKSQKAARPPARGKDHRG
jgi:transcriptional regulator with XRE-family HTH domain